MSRRKNTRRREVISVRDVMSVVSQHARVSRESAGFVRSEGYEARRTCFSDQLVLTWIPAMDGPTLTASPRQESVDMGEQLMERACLDLVEAGYKVERYADLDMTWKVSL